MVTDDKDDKSNDHDGFRTVSREGLRARMTMVSWRSRQDTARRSRASPRTPFSEADRRLGADAMSVVPTPDHDGKSFEGKPRLPIRELTIHLRGKLAGIAAARVPSFEKHEELLELLESAAHRAVGHDVHHPYGRLFPDRPQMLQRQAESCTQLVQALHI
jgi:hypothetical protein